MSPKKRKFLPFDAVELWRGSVLEVCERSFWMEGSTGGGGGFEGAGCFFRDRRSSDLNQPDFCELLSDGDAKWDVDEMMVRLGTGLALGVDRRRRRAMSEACKKINITI